MSSYDSCDESHDYVYHDMSVQDVVDVIDSDAPVVVYFGFADCPWCNSMVNALNDAALERGFEIAYVDTRGDPTWESNVDIDGYDLVVERFGDHLDWDDDLGVPHLYTPHVFFCADGAVVADLRGTVPSQTDPHEPLDEARAREYMERVFDAAAAIGL